MTAQFGPHRWTAGAYDSDHTDAHRGARLLVTDLTGARLTDCDLTGVKVVDSWLVGVDLSGYVDGLVVNGVDVTAFVAAELDRRHPERVQLRELQDADGFRAMGQTVERLWSEAVARAERLPEAMRQERVDEEWSFVQTLRHLVYITDAWASRTVLDQERPYHRLALPQTAYPATDAAALGMDVDAPASYAEALQARVDRLSVLRSIVADLTDADLGRMCPRSPAPGYPEEERPVAECLVVVLEEEIEHYRYATRDLAVLESRPAT
jgi:hypothetical protein